MPITNRIQDTTKAATHFGHSWQKADAHDMEDWDAFRVLIYKAPGHAKSGDYYISCTPDVDGTYGMLEEMNSGSIAMSKYEGDFDIANMGKMKTYFAQNNVPFPSLLLLKWLVGK